LLAEGLADTCTPFIKNEPHPSRKRGKERIVIAVSIVDQLVELALFGSLLDRVHGGYPHLGVISGIGFSDSLSEEFCGVYLTRCDENPGKVPTVDDVHGWDRTLSHQRSSASLTTWMKTCRNLGPRSQRALENRLLAIQNPVYVIRDAKGALTLYERIIPGGMVSGSRITTIGNGTGRVATLYETRGNSPIANGDDGLCWRDDDQSLEDVIELYSKLGIDARGIKFCERGYFEFCSHGFDTATGKSWLLSWPKALFRLATRKTITPDLALDFIREVRHHPRLPEFLAALSRLDVTAVE